MNQDYDDDDDDDDVDVDPSIMNTLTRKRNEDLAFYKIMDVTTYKDRDSVVSRALPVMRVFDVNIPIDLKDRTRDEGNYQ